MDDPAARIGELIPRLRRYALALTGERAAADDLVQDTLERAWRKLGLWRPGSDLRAWLFTVMHNLFINQVRARRASAFGRTDGDPEATLADTAADGGADAGRRTDLMDLDRALAQLPEEQRTVLLLVGLEQFSYQEAAGVLGVPIGTVMSRLHRGRERLRVLLDGVPPPQSLRVVK